MAGSSAPRDRSGTSRTWRRGLLMLGVIVAVGAITVWLLVAVHPLAAISVVVFAILFALTPLFDRDDDMRRSPTGDEPSSYWGGWGRPGM